MKRNFYGWMAVKDSKNPTTGEIEEFLVQLYNPREYICVPNISWGLGLHECDMLFLDRNNLLTEIEIKRSRADLKADALKPHGHRDSRIAALYFCMPEKIADSIAGVPERAGILVLSPYISDWRPKSDPRTTMCVTLLRPAVPNKNARALNAGEIFTMGRLLGLRYWELRDKCRKAQN